MKSFRRISIIYTLIIVLLFTGCTITNQKENSPSQKKEQPNPNLAGIKNFLLTKSTELNTNTNELKKISDQYYELTKSYNFNYQTMWEKDQEKVRNLIIQAKKLFIIANRSYELEEGIVAGVPTLSQFDVNLDAGIAATEGSEDVVTFDLTLPDGRVFKKPGNYFFLVETTLWGTKPEWVAKDVQPDLDKDGKVDFGEVLPDANMLKGSVDGFAAMSNDLLNKSKAWKPTNSEAFTALVVMIPTMEEYFQAWKESRAVSGQQAESVQFVAVSRLSDIVDILTGLEEVYKHVEPMITKKDPKHAEQTKMELSNLKVYVQNIYNQEQKGKTFKPEDADTLGSEAQKRATSIAGQVEQSASKLQIQVEKD
jgi:hypothetical protein